VQPPPLVGITNIIRRAQLLIGVGPAHAIAARFPDA
jgi:hypothetical protein